MAGSELLPMLAIPAVGWGVALLVGWPAARAARLRRFLKDTPTSKTKGVFIGHVEVQGTAETQVPFTSYLAECPCVHYAWSVGEHWSRLVTETYRDSKGNTQTRTRRESGVAIVASGGETQPFYLQDDTGFLLVRPDGARIEALTTFSETVPCGHPLYYAKGPDGAVANSDHRRTFSETAIPLHQPVFVAGTARERHDVVAPEIAASRDAPIFVISVHGEDSIGRGYAWAYWLWTVFGAFVAAVSSFFATLALAGTRDPEPWMSLAGIAAGLGLYALYHLAIWAWMAFNSLQRLRQRVRAAAANIDVELKRRHDLFPRLVEVVKGVRGHERATLELVATLRAQAVARRESGDVAAVSPAVVAIAEAYPELRANTAFLELQRTLSDTETRIALSREYHNGIVAGFNARLLVVPDRLVARLAGMRPFAFFEAKSLEREAPRVALAD
jgi:hypothetical protein